MNDVPSSASACKIKSSPVLCAFSRACFKSLEAKPNVRLLTSFSQKDYVARDVFCLLFSKNTSPWCFMCLRALKGDLLASCVSMYERTVRSMHISVFPSFFLLF
jgi:hypothetical protein